VKKSVASVLALITMTAPLAAAPKCATPVDVAAFRSAAIQQQLMVAALTCNQLDQYNRYVVAYRSELQRSDNELKSYFIRQGSEAAYDTFKTKLANLSSFSTIGDGAGYCATAGVSFDAALNSRQALDDFVAAQPLMITLPQTTLCEAKPVEASVRPARSRVAVKLASSREDQAVSVNPAQH